MPEVGVRELKAHASEILQAVRDRRVRYTVTYRGRPIGVLLPFPGAEETNLGEEDAWAELARLGQEIGRGWRSPLSSAEILDEMRR